MKEWESYLGSDTERRFDFHIESLELGGVPLHYQKT